MQNDFEELKRRFYFSEKSNKNLESEIFDFLEKKEYGNPNLKFIYLFNEEDLLDKDIEKRVSDVLEKLTKMIDKNDIIISFDHQVKPNLNNNQTCKKLVNLTKKFEDVFVGLESEQHTFTVGEVLHANSKIDEIVNKIKSEKLSCTEALMQAYMFVTNHAYVNKQHDSSIPRTIYGVLNSDEIVCVGYCELLKEIMNRLNYKNLKVYLNNVEALIINEVCDKHRNLIVYLKDEKYNLDGYYYIDPTWDAKRKDEEYKFNFFMLPLKEIDNIKEYHINIEEVNFGGITEVSSREKYLSYFYRPVVNDKLSITCLKARLCEEFVKFAKLDKRFSEKIKELSRNKKSFEDFAVYNTDEFLNIIKQTTKDLDIKSFYKILKVVLEKSDKNLTCEQINEKIEKIVKYNIEVSRNCFEQNANTIFRQLKPQKKENKEFQK